MTQVNLSKFLNSIGIEDISPFRASRKSRNGQKYWYISADNSEAINELQEALSETLGRPKAVAPEGDVSCWFIGKGLIAVGAEEAYLANDGDSAMMAAVDLIGRALKSYDSDASSITLEPYNRRDAAALKRFFTTIAKKTGYQKELIFVAPSR